MKTIYLFISLISMTTLSLHGQDKAKKNSQFPRQEILVQKMPPKEQTWVFVLAGQSNMAGRGKVEPIDTIPNDRIITLNAKGEWIYAKEPLHYYEPTLKGTGCGLSFARELLRQIDPEIHIVLLPCAVGGSPIERWLDDALYKNIHLQSNLKEKINIGKQIGTLKAVLWHQGESNADSTRFPHYKEDLKTMFSLIRRYANNEHLPILTGHLGSYAVPDKKALQWKRLNRIISEVVKEDDYAWLIETSDLTCNLDRIHFDTASQRLLGIRFANLFLKIISNKIKQSNENNYQTGNNLINHLSLRY